MIYSHNIVLFYICSLTDPALAQTEIDVTVCGKAWPGVSQPPPVVTGGGRPPQLDVSRVAGRKPGRHCLDLTVVSLAATTRLAAPCSSVQKSGPSREGFGDVLLTER